MTYARTRTDLIEQGLFIPSINLSTGQSEHIVIPRYVPSWSMDQHGDEFSEIVEIAPNKLYAVASVDLDYSDSNSESDRLPLDLEVRSLCENVLILNESICLDTLKERERLINLLSKRFSLFLKADYKESVRQVVSGNESLCMDSETDRAILVNKLVSRIAS